MPKYYFSNGTGLTNLSYIGTDDEESDYPKLTRQVNRLETPYRYDPDPNNIMGDWYRYLVNELYGMPKKAKRRISFIRSSQLERAMQNEPAKQERTCKCNDQKDKEYGA